MYHNDIAEGKRLLLKTKDEEAFLIWNELGRMQWRHSMVQRLAASYPNVRC